MVTGQRGHTKKRHCPISRHRDGRYRIGVHAFSEDDQAEDHCYYRVDAGQRADDDLGMPNRVGLLNDPAQPRLCQRCPGTTAPLGVMLRSRRSSARRTVTSAVLRSGRKALHLPTPVPGTERRERRDGPLRTVLLQSWGTGIILSS